MGKIITIIIIILGISAAFVFNKTEMTKELDSSDSNIVNQDSAIINEDKAQDQGKEKEISNADFYDNRQHQNIDIYIESVDIVFLESFPLQVHAILKGHIPDNCRSGIFAKANYDSVAKTFKIDLRASQFLGMPCMPMPVYFEKSVALDVSGLQKGTYTVKTATITKEFTFNSDNILQ
jgi:inhibitor of cysteine peptidase